jgi:hypothetical protein
MMERDAILRDMVRRDAVKRGYSLTPTLSQGERELRRSPHLLSTGQFLQPAAL